MTLPQERMIEYLYGELTGDELRAFEARLRESEEDRRELAALQATLGSVREGLAHASDEPPARVRQAVLAAAVAHAPRRSATPRWLRTSFVVLPALAVAAAALLVVLGKKIEAPRVHVDEAEARSQLEPSAPPPSAAAPSVGQVVPSDREGAPPSAAAPSAEQSVASDAERARAGLNRPPSAAARARRARDLATGADDAPASSGAAQPRFAEPPPAWKRERVPQPSAATRGAPQALDGLRDDASNAAHSAPAEVESPAGRAQRGGEAPARRAPSPPAMNESANDARAETRASNEAKKARAANAPSTSAPSAAAPAAEAAAPKPSAAKGSAPASVADKAPARDTPGVGAASPAAISFPSSSGALERRARDHFAAKRWREAALDYRELLRREPTSPRAADWKKQLTLATEHDTTSTVR